MRTGQLTADEVFEAEKKAADRQEHRKAGFSLREDRDQAETILSNGVRVAWSVPRPIFPKDNGFYIYPRYIPEGYVEIDGKLYEKEELSKWLRWA